MLSFSLKNYVDRVMKCLNSSKKDGILTTVHGHKS